MSGLGLSISGLEIRVWGSGFGDQGSGIRIWGSSLGIRVWESEFGDQSLGILYTHYLPLRTSGLFQAGPYMPAREKLGLPASRCVLMMTLPSGSRLYTLDPLLYTLAPLHPVFYALHTRN